MLLIPLCSTTTNASKSWQTGLIVCILLPNESSSSSSSFHRLQILVKQLCLVYFAQLEIVSSTLSLLLFGGRLQPDYDVPDQFAKIKDLLVFVTQFHLTRGRVLNGTVFGWLGLPWCALAAVDPLSLILLIGLWIECE